MVDILFGFDILVAFKTTYIDSSTGLEVLDPKKIALNYIITGRFFVDLAASIPFEEFYVIFFAIEESEDGSGGDEENLKLKLFGLLKLIRLLRLGRIIRYLRFK